MNKLLISKELIENLYINQGLTTYQIAGELNCCQATIWKRLHEFDIKPRYHWNKTDLEREDLKKWYIDQKLSTWKIEKMFDYPRSTIYKKLKEFKIPIRNISSSHIIFRRKDFKGDKLEKAYLIGFRLGDLYVIKRGVKSETISVKCASTHKSQIKLFKKLFSKYGHIIEGKSTKEGKINIEGSLNLSFSFLIDKDPGSYRWVFDEKYFFAFLAGFSDAEGSFFLSRNQAIFSLGNYDNLLLRKIKNGLLNFGVEISGPTTHFRKDRMWSNGYRSNSDYHILSCARKKYLVKLLNSLAPFIQHSDKIRAMQKLRLNIQKRNQKFGNLMIN